MKSFISYLHIFQPKSFLFFIAIYTNSHQPYQMQFQNSTAILMKLGKIQYNTNMHFTQQHIMLLKHRDTNRFIKIYSIFKYERNSMSMSVGIYRINKLVWYISLSKLFSHICAYLVYLTSVQWMSNKCWSYFDFVQLVNISIALTSSDT